MPHTKGFLEKFRITFKLFPKSVSAPIAAFASGLWLPYAYAAPVTFTDEAAFLNAIEAPILESFEGLSTTTQNAAPINTQYFTMTLTPLSSGQFG